MTIPSIRFDNQVNFKISSENTSPQSTKAIPVTKNVPNIGLLFTPTPTKTPTHTPTPTTTTIIYPSQTPTHTPTLTRTPTVTPSITRTSTPTPTPTITQTVTPTFTPSPTVTVTSSVTPTASRGCLIGEEFESTILDANATWNDIAYGNGMYTIIESLNANLYGTSLHSVSLGDGLPASGPEFWKSVTYAQNKFVAVGASPVVAYSSDGIVWSSGSNMPTASVTNYTWNQIIYDDNSDRFIAVASSSSTSVQSRLAISDDGINWSGTVLPTLTSTNNTTINTKNYLCAVINNDILILGSDAINEHVSGSANYRASLLVSTNDGSVWTDRFPAPLDTTNESNYIGSIVRLLYANEVYVALAKGKSAGSDCYRIYYSFTTIDWYLSQTIISADADVLYGGFTVYGGGKFLLVANTVENDYTTYHSENGLSWYTPNTTFTVPVPGIRSLLAAENNNFIILFKDRVLSNISCLDGLGY